MATKKHPTIDLIELSAQLQNLNATIQLCAFAAEARRVLDELGWVKNVFPELGARIDRHITASNDWREYADVSGLVMRNLSGEVQRIIDNMGDHL